MYWQFCFRVFERVICEVYKSLRVLLCGHDFFAAIICLLKTKGHVTVPNVTYGWNKVFKIMGTSHNFIVIDTSPSDQQRVVKKIVIGDIRIFNFYKFS